MNLLLGDSFVELRKLSENSFEFIGIEREHQYFEIAKKRIGI